MDGGPQQIEPLHVNQDPSPPPSLGNLGSLGSFGIGSQDGIIQSNAVLLGEKSKSYWRDWKRYWINDGTKLILIITWALINVGLFMVTYWEFYWGPKKKYYSLYGQGVTFARGAASCLNFNCALILLFVLRNFISWLRGTWLNNIIPFDKNIIFHRYVGWAIAFWAFVHIVAHMFNWLSVQRAEVASLNALLGTRYPSSPTAYQSAFTTLPGATGHAVVLVMVLMYTSSIRTIRRPYFEAFWYTHHLFILFYALLIVHGMSNLLGRAQFWMWVVGPALLYITERVIRIIRGTKEVVLHKAVQHPSKVLELQLSKEKFKYRPGQYIFLNMPYLATHEWHPFTLSSAPSDDYISVHIRVVGDWTTKLSKELNPKGIPEGIVQQDLKYAQNGDPIFKIDGPFGAASEDIFDFKTAVLIGAGIGVTPFASILKFIRYQVARSMDQNLPMPFHKVYFYWISRDRQCFEWFGELLCSLEKNNPNDFLEICAYFTGQVKNEKEIRNIMFQNVEDPDLITGLSSRTHFGRPNWPVIFNNLEKAHSGQKVGVFYCGPAVLSKQLYRQCRKHSSGKKGGCRFVYKKENF